MFKINFVLDPTDPNSQTVAVDFAASQVEAQSRATILLSIYRERGSTGWRITGRDDGPVATGPERR
jgi:hypothetical protein